MTDTKIKLSIPEILLHLVLLAGAFWFFTSILRFVIGDKNDKQILINIIFFLEVTLAFYFIPLKHPLKTSKFGFTLTVLGSILNIYIMIFSAYLTINLVKPRPHYPYFEFVYNLMPLLLCLPLLTYISGFINAFRVADSRFLALCLFPEFFHRNGKSSKFINTFHRSNPHLLFYTSKTHAEAQ